jgi:hypothetical protein
MIDDLARYGHQERQIWRLGDLDIDKQSQDSERGMMKLLRALSGKLKVFIEPIEMYREATAMPVFLYT